MMPPGRAVTGIGKVLAQLPLQCPKPHLSKISTMVQAKRRRPSGICKATARQEQRHESRGLGRGWDGGTAPGWPSQPLHPNPSSKFGAHPSWPGPVGSILFYLLKRIASTLLTGERQSPTSVHCGRRARYMTSQTDFT